MITAATGAVALVIAPVARDHGIDYFIATVHPGRLFQIAARRCSASPSSCASSRAASWSGFVNALAILVFIAQLPQLIGVPWLVYPLVAGRHPDHGPDAADHQGRPGAAGRDRRCSPLVVVVFGITCRPSATRASCRESLPELFIPNVPLTWETLTIIAPYALAMALVGLLESLMTAKLVDDITDTRSNKTREAWGQGVANVLSGLFGGMGGCAMIGQTMINVKASGARTRISTFLAGVFLLVLVVALGDVVAIIPMAALVAVMIMVSVATFDWHSIRPSTLRRMPKSETARHARHRRARRRGTHNLAIGVIVGRARGDGRSSPAASRTSPPSPARS